MHAENGVAALEILRDAVVSGNAVDVILSDINMPGMDGLQFLEKRGLERLALAAPVIMITTEGSQPQVLRALAAGARGYICKPFTPDQVRAAVIPLLAAAAH